MKWILVFYILFGVYAILDFIRTEGKLTDKWWQQIIGYITIFLAGPPIIILSWFLDSKKYITDRWL